MKTTNFLLWIVLCIMPISCSAQRTLSEVSSIKGVTSIFIGKTMLKLAGSAVKVDSDKSGVDYSRMVKDLSSIEIIQCENPRVAEEVQKKCDKILSQYPMEIITEVTSDEENVEISGVFNDDGKTMSMLLIKVKDKDEPTYILLKGKIDVDTLAESLHNESN